MATVLETFFARLGFEVDESGFANAQNKLANVSKSILGLGIFSGVSVAGIMKLVGGTAEALGAVERLHLRTGLATEAIAGMSKAGAGFGITSDAMQASLQNVNNALGGVIIQEPRAIQLFRRLGLSATDAAGAQKDVVTFLGDVAERMRGLPTAAQARLLSRLGIDQNMITMLRGGREAFMELYETASAGVLFRPEDYQRAEEFQRLFGRVRGIMTTIGQNIGLEIMRPMMGLLDAIGKWWASNGKRMMEEMRGRLRMWLEGFSLLTNVFSKFSQHGDTIVRVVEALGVALGLLVAVKVAQWVGSILTAFGGWGAALVAIGVLIYLLIDDFLTWRAGGESFIGWLEENFPAGFESVRQAVHRVWDAIKELWQTLKDLWAENGPAIKEFAAEIGKLFLTVGVEALILALNSVRRSLTAISAIIKYLTPITRDWWAGQKKQAEEFNAVLLKVMEWWDSLGITSGNVGERIKATWRDWMEEIKSDWAQAGEFIKANMGQWRDELVSDWEKLSTRFSEMVNNIKSFWGDLAANIRQVWENLMGWLMPWLERIENFFGTFTKVTSTAAKTATQAVGQAASEAASSFTDKAKGFAQKAFSWLPTMPTAPALAPAMAGGAPMVPSSITNAPQSSTMTHNTDVQATINVQAPSPEQAAEMTARKVNDLARTNVRHGQGFDF